MASQIFSIAFRSVVVYLFIVACTRLFGKTELSQLSLIDLVLILLISNSVQNAMVGSDSTLLGGIVAAGILFIVDYILKFLLDKFPKLSKTVQGEPILLIYKGEINKNNLNKAKMDTSDLAEALRQNGIINIKDVKLAILEVDGHVSIIPYGKEEQSGN
ncbi:DUF421 domain-containing protein [Coprothermobacter platensis]|uniref:DUF421 domain-containing protein n=1 Tax=Coprothermobacter platensis TaxID=108819 RepID=UPI00036D67A4|nr:YetF domain-containing protein [Coprothermobacter platensis]